MNEIARAGGDQEALAAAVQRLAFWRSDYGELLPRGELAGIMEVLENSLLPCGPQRAAELARILIGSYPSRAVHDPVIFARAIVSVLAEIPEDLARHAIDKLTRENKFLPTRAEVFEACGAAAKSRVTALFNARRQFKRHELCSMALTAFPDEMKSRARALWEQQQYRQRTLDQFIEREAVNWAKYSAPEEIRRRMEEY